ncbi:RagB/SusD domain protein [Paludibacter propionicigenes WB4]|uniref:RagB/SusD domain protein n=1 Tax=Paludibacter propionicigenes (strain DSM 17365 / JCM 13257 / WB4) TaxID=694427 RepID=E4T7F8_PALPW|nr:RagB/SusD family nutrient uptake outer membrane protein [Paludibacter propionicigenes]ADQ80652.1 RagB/SusD domain protein [Paludibacter propionicigenes WB4]
MKSQLYIILSAFLCLSFVGCEKYVDIKTQGKLVPGDIDNYRYLLNNTSGYEMGPRLTDIASDDVELVDGSTQYLALSSSDNYGYWPKAYTWQAVIYPIGNYQSDDDWNSMYNTVTYSNVVINEVPTSKGGTESQKAALIAEALVHRADAYLMLVNKYAKPYKASTAVSDLGVPMILTETTEQSLKRPSIQAVYDQIIADLKKAIPSLPLKQLYTTLPSKPSAYGELARTYLCMNDYANAKLYADSALLYRSTLNDLSTITALSSTTYPRRISDPEILLSKTVYGGVSAYTPYALRLSSSLLTLLGTKDQRYNLFTTAAANISSSYTAAGGRFFYKDRALNEGRNIGPSVPEMMLIEAEYYARNNKPEIAMDWLNALRKKRFKAADYVDLSATDLNDALKKVIDERHREFFCRMLRWWDMRRLKDDPMFAQTYTRTLAGITYTLAPTSNRYIFSIPAYQIKLSPEMEQNPE